MTMDARGGIFKDTCIQSHTQGKAYSLRGFKALSQNSGSMIFKVRLRMLLVRKAGGGFGCGLDFMEGWGCKEL